MKPLLSLSPPPSLFLPPLSFSISESPSSVVDWPSLRKRDFDNISAYYAKKEERIKNKKIKLDPSEDEPVKT